jgi:hypothetical protein
VLAGVGHSPYAEQEQDYNKLEVQSASYHSLVGLDDFPFYKITSSQEIMIEGVGPLIWWFRPSGYGSIYI